MALIKSISGFRGTIGGKTGEGLTPIDAVKFAAAYGTWILGRNKGKSVVVGRDARISGEMINNLVCSTLIGLGIDIIDLGLSTTPTVEMAVVFNHAAGGIILTASHNPAQWNALKLLNEKGEFISAQEGEHIIQLAEAEDFFFAQVNDLGKFISDNTSMEKHVDAILNLPYVDVEAIRKANLSVVVDAINSTGAVFVPYILNRLGVINIHVENAEMNGNFAHNPEPLAENLIETSKIILAKNAQLGIIVDPDVDRLAFICEDGTMFGEEYTLVACADHVLSIKPGNTVSNLSSTRALRDITETRGLIYAAAAVGEVNVVNKMREIDAVIGGEGNGGVILPELHSGRDALVGIAIFLTSFVQKGLKASELRDSFPKYVISKNKIELTPEINVDLILEKMAANYRDKNEVDITDGVKIYIEKEWVHLRKSNTEPIIRIYAESKDEETANQLALRVIAEIKEIVG